MNKFFTTSLIVACLSGHALGTLVHTDSSISSLMHAQTQAESQVQGNVGGLNWMSGEVMTWETYKYGKFQTRIKGVDKKGTCTSFFTFWKGDAQEPWHYGGWSEIDVELVPSSQYGTYSTNIIWENIKQNHWVLDHTVANPQDDWHLYEFQWTPNYVAWFYDGQEVRRVTDTEDVRFLQKREQHLMMNFWIPGFEKWHNGFTEAGMPWHAQYDFVEFWEYVPEERQAEEGVSSDHPFKFTWKDDFDTFDESRWKKSHRWSFHDNLTIFMDYQVYVENGQLVLRMEPASENPPPRNEELPAPTPFDESDQTDESDSDNEDQDSNDDHSSDNDDENSDDGHNSDNGEEDHHCNCEDQHEVTILEIQATMALLEKQLAAFKGCPTTN